jgi:hypothetical protein
MSTDYVVPLSGVACPIAGSSVHVTGMLARQAAAPLNIAGTYTITGTWTNTGAGLPPLSGTTNATRVRTQAAGSSAIRSTVTTTSGGPTYTCLGPIIGNMVYGTCNGVSANGVVTYVISGVGTVSAGPPVTVSMSTQGTIQNDPGNYTATTGTSLETRQ